MGRGNYNGQKTASTHQACKENVLTVQVHGYSPFVSISLCQKKESLCLLFELRIHFYFMRLLKEV